MNRLWLICLLLLTGGLTVILWEKRLYSAVSAQQLRSVREKIKILSPQEKQDLAFFIRRITLFDQFSYTLIGYKPMSVAIVIIEDTEDMLPCHRGALKNANHQALRRGYLVWKKYQSLFPKAKEILFEYSFLGKGRKEIAVVAPRLCKAVIQGSLRDFQEILGKPYTSEEVFSILTHPTDSDFHTIIDHTRLIGILLGFGRNNAHLYERHRGGASRSVIEGPRSARDSLEMFSNEWPLPGRHLSPNFSCDASSEETLLLKTLYNAARKTVYWTYFLRNNLEVTLALLEQPIER